MKTARNIIVRSRKETPEERDKVEAEETRATKEVETLVLPAKVTQSAMSRVVFLWRTQPARPMKRIYILFVALGPTFVPFGQRCHLERLAY